MPTQNPIVLVIFFYLVARFDALTASANLFQLPAIPTPNPRFAWIAGVLIAVGYAPRADSSCSREGHYRRSSAPPSPIATTSRAAIPASRSPRDRRSAGPGSTRRSRWPVPSRYLVIRYHISNPDAATHPVKLRISTSCQTLVDEFQDRFRRGRPRVRAAGGPEERVVFDTDVSRTTGGRPTAARRTPAASGRRLRPISSARPAVVASQAHWIPLKPCQKP